MAGPGHRLAVRIAALTGYRLLGPIGWAFPDEILDVAAMNLTWRLLGFHPLLLPTFAFEFLPIPNPGI